MIAAAGHVPALSLPKLLHLPAGAYGGALGGWVPAPRPVPRRLALPGALLAGAVGGITGGPAAFPAALVVIWCGLLGWPKIRQRAVFQPYILVMQVATLGLIRLLG